MNETHYDYYNVLFWFAHIWSMSSAWSLASLELSVLNSINKLEGMTLVSSLFAIINKSLLLTWYFFTTRLQIPDLVVANKCSSALDCRNPNSVTMPTYGKLILLLDGTVSESRVLGLIYFNDLISNRIERLVSQFHDFCWAPKVWFKIIPDKRW